MPALSLQRNRGPLLFFERRAKVRKGAFTFSFDFGLVFRGGCGAAIKAREKRGFFFFFFFF